MTGPRPHHSYRHEAFLYRDPADFLAGLVPFVRAGVAAGQPVMVALRPTRADPLRAALGPDAAAVHFVDMTELGHNPARIIPGWRRFLDEHCRGVRPVRGIGEPIWSDRSPAEIVEAQLHEALLNLAVDPDTPMWLRCPYDLGALTRAQLAEAAHSHPLVVRTDGYAGSRSYGGRQHVDDLLAADLPGPPETAEELALPADSGVVAALVTGHAAVADLGAERTWALSVAAQESAGCIGAGGTLRVWAEPSAMVCELHDPRALDDPLAGRRPPGPDRPDPLGLWLANQVCDLVQVRTGPDGTSVRMVNRR